jgi:mono/diheme cytochrome c family protein
MSFILSVPLLFAEETPKPNLEVNSDRAYQGRVIFERNCIICHGVRGDGKGEMAKELPIKPRSFREGWFKFRSTPFGKLPTPDDLRKTITGGLTGTAMGMFSNLSHDEVDVLIEYIRSLSRRWRKEENYAPPIELPKTPEWFEDYRTVKEHAQKGKPLFQALCSACHGQTGAGNGMMAAQLNDVWGNALKPADLRAEHLRCGDTAPDIYRLLTTGMNGTPMLSFAGLSEEQRWELAAFILSLRPSANESKEEEKK